MLEFIDKIVIPFLDQLYGAFGYLGVLIAMTIESAMIPLPSELILPFAGFLVSDPTKIEPLTGSALELLDRGHRGDDREHHRVAHRLRHRGLGRPAVPREVRQVHPHPAARHRAGRPVLREMGRPDGVLQPTAADRPDVHQLPGRGGPDEPAASSSSTRRPAPSCGRCCWSTPGRCSARTGPRSGTRSSRSTS